MASCVDVKLLPRNVFFFAAVLALAKASKRRLVSQPPSLNRLSSSSFHLWLSLAEGSLQIHQLFFWAVTWKMEHISTSLFYLEYPVFVCVVDDVIRKV